MSISRLANIFENLEMELIMEGRNSEWELVSSNTILWARNFMMIASLDSQELIFYITLKVQTD